MIFPFLMIWNFETMFGKLQLANIQEIIINIIIVWHN